MKLTHALAPITALILATGAAGVQAMPHNHGVSSAETVSVSTTVEGNLVLPLPIPLPPLPSPNGLPTCC